MNILKLLLCISIVSLLISCNATGLTNESEAGGDVSASTSLSIKFDALLSEQYQSDQPGAAALVAIDGEVVYEKGFGLANIELNVPIKPEMVFEIGSITKQFTAVAILMLVEEGKLSLDDEITKFLPHYPTKGHTITLHHLLTHTSGIKSYTSMESWTKLWRQDLSPLELINIFKDEPMDFEPGEQFLYNNSAYFILGYVIEKASGLTYQDYIHKEIFEPVGMTSSYYGSAQTIIPNRASGYQQTDKIINAEYLSMSQPYAAGSLMSTVHDLFKWNQAIRSNQLINQASTEKAFTNYELNNGEKVGYGYGWFLSEINGSSTKEHGGGIFGYVTNSIYLPEENVFVAVLSNTDFNGPGFVSTKMAAIAIDKPYPEFSDDVSVDTDELASLVGVYDFDDGATRFITMHDGSLYSQREGGTKFLLHPTADGMFYFEGSFSNLRFTQEDGKTEVLFKSRASESVGIKTDKPVPVKTEITLDSATLMQFVGVFELQPGFDITITLEDDKLMSQATGQQKFQIYPMTKSRFFLKVVDAELEFIANENGAYTSMILYQGGQEIPAQKKTSN
ncbi:serine hydrolase [Alteromonas sp. W364]|uniref:serine hydrolase n=1 Tax=Alteromonas sp. W364 TaxID=3075610 RepID=UPI002886A239|nr:serine hydrolase [Alteromonas sp. W364]MDT0627945.1 serine hydrolase [Alteromonas sp. W364]